MHNEMLQTNITSSWFIHLYAIKMLSERKTITKYLQWHVLFKISIYIYQITMKHISNNFLQILNMNIIAILVLPPYIIFYNILPQETPQTLDSLRKE